jgi:hypothetical protein
LADVNFFLERVGRSDDECVDVQHLIRFMVMIVVVNVVLDIYHEKEMMKKKLDKVKMTYCDICHDRPSPSFCNNNNKNKNKNMRTPPMTIKKPK